MQYKIYGQQRSHPYVYLDVELLPENRREQEAIDNCRNMQAEQEDKDIVANYVLFRLKGVSMDWLQGNRVLVKSSLV